MAPGESLISPYQVRATPGYLETLKVPLLRGRFFTEADTATSPRVVIVDEPAGAEVLARPGSGRPPHVPTRQSTRT